MALQRVVAKFRADQKLVECTNCRRFFTVDVGEAWRCAWCKDSLVRESSRKKRAVKVNLDNACHAALVRVAQVQGVTLGEAARAAICAAVLP